MHVKPGVANPLGATWDGAGVNFAIYSENASGVELCLFDEERNEVRIPLRHSTGYVWHSYVEGIGPGQMYGYRVDGPWEPERGLRFNPGNVLLDPYAKAVAGPESWDDGVFSYELGHPDADLKKNVGDSSGAPLGVVIDGKFDWEDDRPPRVPFHRSVIYEAHVRGLTIAHPEVPPEWRGKYSGLSSPPMIDYFQRLGVTSIELLPIHLHVDDARLVEKGLSNYWGYDTINFFTPDVRYRSRNHLGSGVREVKMMVKELHRAGIEVILDVVYNHTAEGNHLGPTFSFKGIDNPTYYRLVEDDPRHYFDYTGTGNSLNVRHPQTLQLIMDSLRYWITEMHVDGFRFDLAAALARGLHEVDQLSSFFTIIHQDPVISEVKLIAEPWDVGDGGYQVGNFPTRWAEWNGKYRDAVRSFWRGLGRSTGELGYRLSGSSDLYSNNGRSPFSSVNFVVAHDGFTLRDLVSYDHKHNEDNGEDNRDGTDDNMSWNCGVEGPTDDPQILELRARQMRNLMATVLLSQGTPMLAHGDEYGRTQRGNNNAYCQDNEISWFDWRWDEEAKAMFAFTKKLLQLRRDHPALRRAKFFKGRKIRGSDIRDILWLRHDGEEMTDADWDNPHTASLGMLLAGSGIDEIDEDGHRVVDDDLYIVLNGSDDALEFVVPTVTGPEPWTLAVDTADDSASGTLEPGSRTRLEPRSLQLLVHPRELRGAQGPGAEVAARP